MSSLKTVLCFLGLLAMHGTHPALAQPTPERHQHALINAILEELKPEAMTKAQRGPDGRYHWQPKQPPALRLLLLDQSYAGPASKFLLAADGTPDNKRLRQYFSDDDLRYMRQQLTMNNFFRHRQANIPQPWVRVLPTDTLQALSRRLGWLAELRFTDSLVQRYGSYTTFAISKPLFSEDHTHALVNVSGNSETRTCVYQKIGSAWRRKEALSVIISD